MKQALVAGTFNATLAIQGDTWETITVPLSLFIADVDVNPSSILNIPQEVQGNIAIYHSINCRTPSRWAFRNVPTQLRQRLSEQAK